MRLALLALAASLAAATPALANESRVEARGGVIWADNNTEATAGIAAGYDFSLAPMTFVGVEASGDKVLSEGNKVAFGVSGRAGVAVGPMGKVYAVGGYTSEFCDTCEDSWNLGAGYQQNFLVKLYGKVEYRRHFFGNNAGEANQVTAGLGLRF